RRLQKELSFAVIDTHFGFPEGVTGMLLSLAFRVPFTMTFRGNEPKHSRGRLARFCMRQAVRRASRVFAVSGRLGQFAIGLGADPKNVKTIPNGVDVNVFFPRNRDACRTKHGISPGKLTILSAGALVERKGHHRIIAALKTLAADGATPELIIAGG